MNRAEALKQLNEYWLTECLCGLKNSATQAVLGEGDPNARVLFIGEAPGAKEDREGRPFIGSAGKILGEMLADIRLKRENVYITNIVKYRPPNNRDPLPEEILACAEWLENEIRIVSPDLIVFLGRHAMNRFFPSAKIGDVHGTLLAENLFGKQQKFLPLYHPAATIYNRALRATLREDFQKIRQELTKITKR